MYGVCACRDSVSWVGAPLVSCASETDLFGGRTWAAGSERRSLRRGKRKLSVASPPNGYKRAKYARGRTPSPITDQLISFACKPAGFR